MNYEENYSSTLDIRTKFCALIMASGLVMSAVPLWIEIAILLVIILMVLTGRNYKLVCGYTFWYLLFSGIMTLSFEVSPFSMVILLACRLFRSFIPCFLIGTFLIQTTRISDLFSAFAKLKIPYRFAIPFAVVLRFFPTLTEEWKHIKMAMKIRGIGMSLEYIMVPLLYSATTINDELIASSLTRGLGSSEIRCNVRTLRLQMLDVLFITSTVVLFALTF